MSSVRRQHDFRRVTDMINQGLMTSSHGVRSSTSNRAFDGDTLYRMPSHRIDSICQTINLNTQGVSNHERSE
jgi:hypothetical protein